MGNGGASKTNKMLESQTGRANAISDTAMDRSQSAWDQSQGLRDELLGNYRNLYKGIGVEDTGGGGGGGGGFREEALPGIYDPRQNETADFWREGMKSGFMSDADKANELSYATGPISGMFDALRRNMQTSGAGAGGYTSGMGALARDQAYQASDLAKGVASDQAKRIIANRMGAGQELSGLDEAFQNRQKQAVDEKIARAKEANANARNAANAAAARRRGDIEGDLGDRMAILGRMQGLMPDDLSYMDRGLSGVGMGGQLINSRRDETPMWQKMAGDLVKGAAGALSGGLGSALGGVLGGVMGGGKKTGG